MIAEKAYLEAKFAEYNDMLFDGILPAVPIRMSRGHSYLGRLEYKCRRGLFVRDRRPYDFVIRMNGRYDLPEQEIQDTLIHEMIHLAIAVRGVRDSSAHGRVFRAMMHRINTEFGRHITISHRKTESEFAADAAIGRVRVVAVSHLEDGRVGVTVPAGTRVDLVRRQLPRFFRLAGPLEWYRTDHPFFARFPRSLRAKIYIVDRDELKTALESAEKIIQE